MLAFLDESGNVTPFNRRECFLAVAFIAGSIFTCRSVRLHVKRLRTTVGLRRRQEIKAANSSPDQILRFLEAIAEEDIYIVATIVDKRYVYREPDDPEEWYREAVATAALYCVSQWPGIRLTLDKRYTNPGLRLRLEEAIRSNLGDLDNPKTTIAQRDSTSCLELQAVDFVAWAIRRKYEYGEDRYYSVISKKIVIEERLEVK